MILFRRLHLTAEPRRRRRQRSGRQRNPTHCSVFSVHCTRFRFSRSYPAAVELDSSCPETRAPHTTRRAMSATGQIARATPAMPLRGSIRAGRGRRAVPWRPVAAEGEGPGNEMTLADGGADDLEVVRYGLARGSAAFYPRGTTAAATPPAVGFDDGGALRRRDTDASTTYDDGVLDKLAVRLFNWKLETALNNDAGDSPSSAAATPPPLPPGGFPRLVALADRIALSRPPAAQRQVVLGTLLGLIPGRGILSSTFRLNVSAVCGIGGAFRGCSGGV